MRSPWGMSGGRRDAGNVPGFSPSSAEAARLGEEELCHQPGPRRPGAGADSLPEWACSSVPLAAVLAPPGLDQEWLSLLLCSLRQAVRSVEVAVRDSVSPSLASLGCVSCRQASWDGCPRLLLGRARAPPLSELPGGEKHVHCGARSAGPRASRHHWGLRAWLSSVNFVLFENTDEKVFRRFLKRLCCAFPKERLDMASLVKYQAAMTSRRAPFKP